MIEIIKRTAGGRSSCSPATRISAKSRPAPGGDRVSNPRSGDRASLGTPLAISSPRQTPSSRHIEFLAGGRRRRRGVQLRHHRQTARLRPQAIRLHRRGSSRSMPRRVGIRRVPDPVGDPDAATGIRPADAPSAGSRGPRGPGSSLALDGIWPTIFELVTAGSSHYRLRISAILFRV